MANFYPKISIVTPSFEQASFLEAAIRSVLNQNYPNLEYVIIDGGSTDGSVDIIKKYQQHLHYWCSEPDNGQYEAINKGFSHTTGEIMAWLNSDDMYCPWAFKTVASIMSDLPEVEWLTTLNPGHWDMKGFCKGFGSIAGFSREAFLDGCYLPTFKKFTISWIQQESTFWKRDLWEKSGKEIPTEFSLAGDFELWSRFYRYAELYGTTSPLGGFRFQNKQRSQDKVKYIAEAEVSLSRIRDFCQWSPRKSRDIAMNLRLHQLPKIRKTFEPLYTYTGKRIQRANYDSSEGYWEIEAYRFS